MLLLKCRVLKCSYVFYSIHKVSEIYHLEKTLNNSFKKNLQKYVLVSLYLMIYIMASNDICHFLRNIFDLTL